MRINILRPGDPCIVAPLHANDYELVAVFEDAGLSGASMSRREGLHGAMKAAGKGMAPVSYSISRLARSTRDMLELAFLSAGGPADRKDITTVNFKYLLSLGCAVAAPLVASGSRSEARRFFPRRGPRSNQWYQAKRNGDGIVRWDAQCAHLARPFR
jgi:hypothetical protein